MQTGHDAVMIEDQLEVLQYSLGLILFLGVLESKPLCHGQAQKLNTSLWQMQLLKSFGFNHFLIPNSSRSDSTQMISAVAFAKDLYSASVLDRDTVACFLALQEYKIGPKEHCKTSS